MGETKKSDDRNCQNCIFNLRNSEQSTEFGQSIGASMCGAGLGPTELPDATPEQNHKVGQLKAASCDQYSMATDGYATLDEAPESLPVVMLPNPKVIGDARKGNAAGASVSCLNCAFYVQPRESLEAGLWNAGLCAARGIMILNRNTLYAAATCEDKTAGERRTDLLEGMMLMPEYTAALQVDSAVASFSRTAAPTETYESDADVTPEDTKKGVKAWRQIRNPEGSGVVMLPIFDPEFFDEDLRKAIPKTGDDEHPEEYVDHMGLVYKCAVLWMHLDETPAIWGVAGTGKTEFYRHMAWLMGLPFHRISITASTEVEDLAGKMHYEPSRGTYFEYGRIPKAWQTAGVVCLDEPNVGPPDVWQFIRPLTDNSKQLVLDMNNGERVTRHELAFLGMAMNPSWDIRNAGTTMLADADGSRLMHIYLDMPTEEVEREIIKARVALDDFELSDESLNAVMGIAKDLRLLSKNESLPITWGVRQQIKVARSLKYFEFPQAYRLAAADYLEPESQEMILDVVKSHSPLAKRDAFEPARKKGAAPTDTDRAKARRTKVTAPGVAPKAPPVPPKAPGPMTAAATAMGIGGAGGRGGVVGGITISGSGGAGGSARRTTVVPGDSISDVNYVMKDADGKVIEVTRKMLIEADNIYGERIVGLTENDWNNIKRRLS